MHDLTDHRAYLTRMPWAVPPLTQAVQALLDRTVPSDWYRNLRGGLDQPWSGRSRRREGYGRVFARPAGAFIQHATLVVSDAGRERVRRERQKNVHAVIRGAYLCDIREDGPLSLCEARYRTTVPLGPDEPDSFYFDPDHWYGAVYSYDGRPDPWDTSRTAPPSTWRPLTYDPYRHETFVDMWSGAPVLEAPVVWLHHTGRASYWTHSLAAFWRMILTQEDRDYTHRAFEFAFGHSVDTG